MALKNRFNIFLAFILVITVLLNSGYYLTTLQNENISLFFLILSFILLLLSRVILKKYKKTRDYNIYFIILVIANLLSIIANFNIYNLLSGFYIIVMIFTAYLIVCRVKFIIFRKYYIIVLKIISIISIVFFLVLSFINITNLPTVVNDLNHEYYNFIFFSSLVKNTDRLIRNAGIFWESGLFSSFLIFGIIFEIFPIYGKTNKYNIALFIITIVSTSSTAGVLLSILLLFLLFISKTNKINHSVKIFLYVFFIIIIILFYKQIIDILISISPKIFNKLVDINSESLSNRLDSPIANMFIFLKKPIFGFGFTEAASEYSMYTKVKGLYNLAQTSTSTQILSSLGFLGIFYSLGFVLPIIKYNRKILDLPSKLTIIIILLVIINKEPHVHILTTWIMFFYLTQKNNYIIKNRSNL